jgi:undecaprenyl diphosphate synthase
MHLAIIMDGNGRWAKAQGKNRTEGHKKGAQVVKEITNILNAIAPKLIASRIFIWWSHLWDY